jgi:hypothetical protein
MLTGGLWARPAVGVYSASCGGPANRDAAVLCGLEGDVHYGDVRMYEVDRVVAAGAR